MMSFAAENVFEGASEIDRVIIETALLSQDEKVMACELSKKAGADFVKTSTGSYQEPGRDAFSFQAERNLQSKIQFQDLCLAQSADEISQCGLWDTHQLITVNRAVVLQAFGNPNKNLGGQTIE